MQTKEEIILFLNQYFLEINQKKIVLNVLATLEAES